VRVVVKRVARAVKAVASGRRSKESCHAAT
jgi:hypothetical protein